MNFQEPERRPPPIYSIAERYRNDPSIRMLVDVLESQISALHLTPTEIRECAVLAAINYERRQSRRIMVTPEEADIIRGFAR